eukprot:CAMPEP_0175073468 /NCGR_PEP_ID=MMETSP0052_2-20121109/20588_1 /TAXON_ID=51329 ORGANISM="Polytomella parva, Strain SAG 63-3" /NCGR_SAMPLE_ID=MMETSP0052_2 /ASSEMBLY_ACC=CAM_ASM_000194 /LENGTH=41 /DNA_ID= /DNA_START= /DNA_END= /DNA_ORIENTATION=
MTLIAGSIPDSIPDPIDASNLRMKDEAAVVDEDSADMTLGW